MSDEPAWGRWQGVLDRMFEELAAGTARAEAYWAQQIPAPLPSARLAP